MTVAALTPEIEYTEDGVTVGFAVPFRYRDPSHLVAERIAADGTVTVLTEGTDYSAAAGDTDAGGTLTTTAPAVSGTRLRIRRDTPRVQDTNYITTGAFKAESHEDTMDELAMVDQEQDVRIADTASRAPLVPNGQVAPDMDLSGLIDGDIIQYTGGKLKRLDRSAFAGKFYAGDGTGRMIPATSTGGGDAALRSDLADNVAGASLVAYKRSGTGAVAMTVKDQFDLLAATPQQFGAVGDGVADDSAAFQAACDAALYVFVPPGKYLLGSTVTLNDGQRLYGCGTSAWEPYVGTGTAFPDVTRSEILVDGTRAFSAASKNSVTVEGIAIKAVGGEQSTWPAAAGKQVGAIGIDITSSTQFVMDDVSFHGLEIAVDANQTGGSADTQMPRISNWMASDCGTVFRFGNASSAVHTVRDARISDCVIALHCDKMIDAHWCDGFRLENLRLFQSAGKSIYIRETPFVSFNGVTVFETSDDQVTLEDCVYVSLSGISLARAGAYAAAPPYPPKRALTLINCQAVAVQGQIQQPTDRAIQISGCIGVAINCAIGTPFWTNGGSSNISGAIHIETSEGVNVNGSVDGNAQVAVYADLASSRTLSGSIATGDDVGVSRAVQLQQRGGYVIREDAAIGPIGAGGTTATFHTLRIFIPAGKILRTRCVEMTSPDIVLRVGGVFWTGASAEGGGSVSFEDKVLYDNSGGPDGWYQIALTFHNPTAGDVTVPDGHETRISTAIV